MTNLARIVYLWRELKLNKEFTHKLRSDGKGLLALFLISIILVKLLFYNERFVVVLRMVFSFFWLFVVPGFSLMYYWHDKVDFIQRFVLGVLVGAAITGLSSYYLGLLGLHIKYHGFLLPLLFVGLASLIVAKKKG